MQKITSAEQLKTRIRELELTCELEREDLRLHLMEVKDAFRPANLLRDTIKGFISSPESRGKILNVVIGMAAGYVTKKAVFGATHNPLKKLAGALLQMGVAGTVSRNGDGIQHAIGNLIKRLTGRRSHEQEAALEDAYSQL